MTDTGLSDRLRQQSRRSGLMVGLSMALTIGICVGGFVATYTRVGSALSDFLPQDATFVPTEQPAPEAAQAPAAEPSPTPAPPPPDAAQQAQPQPEPTAVAADSPFEPTHQSSSAGAINFRSSPGVAEDNSNLIRALSIAEPLEYLGNEQTVNGDDGAVVWMNFQDQNGERGWIREIDAETFVP